MHQLSIGRVLVEQGTSNHFNIQERILSKLSGDEKFSNTRKQKPR